MDGASGDVWAPGRQGGGGRRTGGASTDAAAAGRDDPGGPGRASPFLGRSKTKQSAGTPATAALSRAGVTYAVHPYEHDPASTAFGEEVVAALGLPAERVFKTLVVDVDGQLAVAVVPVAGQLDLKAFAAARGGKKAALARQADAERTTGYVVGGISPLGQRKRLPTVVDESALGFETVFCSAGKRGLQVELAPADLVRLTGAVTAPIGRA